ncbi:MAG: hypothetical protein U0U70_04450 [Chitinophagaceae bacterium]
MKKQFFILFGWLLWQQAVPAQHCACLPNSWELTGGRIEGQSFEPADGMKLKATCFDSIYLVLRYKSACPVKYKVTITDSLGHRVDAWESMNNNPPPSNNVTPVRYGFYYQFRQAGYYTMEIRPAPGESLCAPVRFHFSISSPEPCPCSANGWKDFTATINNQVSTVQDGHKFYLLRGKTIQLEGNYRCKENCTSKYSVRLTNLVGGQIITTYYKVGELAWTHQFQNEGIFKLEITPACGSRNCTVASFEFTIQKP